MTSSDTILHWDVDDFYMTGSRSHHLGHVPIIARAHERNLVKEALECLLNRQILKTSVGNNEQIFQMIEGAGQGLNYASATASASFLHSVELTGPGIARSSFKERKHQMLLAFGR